MAVAIAHRTVERGLGPTHIYTSDRFDSTFGWHAGRAPMNQIRAALRIGDDQSNEEWVVEDLRRDPRVLSAEKMSTGYSSIVLLVPESRVHALARRLTHTPGGVLLAAKSPRR